MNNEIINKIITIYQANAGSSSIISMLLMFGVMFLVMYLVVIRPQQKQQKKHQQLIASLKKGDEVILSSGMYAKIHSIEDKTLLLEIATKTYIKVLKQVVQTVSIVNNENINK